jgi:hypothetical protein
MLRSTANPLLVLPVIAPRHVSHCAGNLGTDGIKKLDPLGKFRTLTRRKFDLNPVICYRLDRAERVTRLANQMASPSFAFIPRNISKGGKQQGTSARVPSSHKSASTPAIERESVYPGPSVSDKGKRKVSEPSAKPVYSEKDISILLVLAFSDYALWLDSDLRRKIEESLQGEEHDAGCMFPFFCTRIRQGLCSHAVLPLSYLMRRAFGRENLGQEYMPTEANAVKAIRTYAGDVLEVRMLVSAPSASAWYPSWKPERDSIGGYEVRRKDWSTLLDNATREFTRSQWDDRTIYMVGTSL